MRLALAGGGTGGHLLPGLAVAEELEKEPGSESLFFLSSRDPEESGARLRRCRRVRVPAAPLSGSFLRRPRSLIENLDGWRLSRRELAGFQAEAILGLGGFVSAPPVLAATTLRIPVVLYEQNTVPGRANRFLTRFAGRIALGFPLRRGAFPAGKTFLTGNPILPAAAEGGPPGAGEEWGLREGAFTLLVMGGSRGAHFLNRLMIESIPFWGDRTGGIQILHLSGAEDENLVRSAYRTGGIRARVWPFWDRMGWLYRRADLLIARSGALTLSEAAHWGLPALLVPYPYATDGHQAMNAGYFQEQGAAIAVEEGALTGRKLAETVTGLMRDRASLERMREAARRLARPESARAILELVREAIKENKIRNPKHEIRNKFE